MSFHLTMYMPNKYIDNGDQPTSPRTFYKDSTLEETVGRAEFSLGHLLNLVQIRLQVVQAGTTLDALLAAGTPTQKFWLNAWMKSWLEPKSAVDVDTVASSQLLEPLETSESDGYADAVSYHACQYAESKLTLMQWQVSKDVSLHKRADARWLVLMNLIKRAGKLGPILFSVSSCTTRKGTVQPCVHMAHFDYMRYSEIFAAENVFGDVRSYQHLFSDNLFETLPAEGEQFQQQDGSSTALMTTLQVSNVAAMEARCKLDVSVSGERRHSMLAAAINRIRTHGVPVTFQNGEIEACESSEFWAVAQRYVVHDGFGSAYEKGCGIQTLTNESRCEQLRGMTVGELDLVAAVYQIFLKELLTVSSPEEYDTIAHIVELYIERSGKWADAVAAYYGIGPREAKKIFQRIYAMGSPTPDDKSAERANDVLQCVAELQFAFRQGHLIIADRSMKYKQIAALPKVIAARN